VLAEIIDLLVDIFALFSLFLRLLGLALLELLLLISLGGLGKLLHVLFLLLLDVLLDFSHVVLFLLLKSFGNKLMVVDNVITVVSNALLAELDWVLIVSNVLSVVIVIEMAVELHKLVATLILFLRVDFLHLLILLLLVLNHGVGLVLQVLSPQLCIITSVLVLNLHKVEVALTLHGGGSGSISLIRVWNVIRVVIVIGNLDHLVVIKLLSLSLNVVALVVLVEEPSEVAVGTELRIVQLLVIVSNSLHVFWSIDDLWVVWRLVVSFLESVRSVDALILSVELEPVGAL